MERFPSASKNPLSLADIINISLFEKVDKERVCLSVPSGVSKDGIYIVDLNAVNGKDLTTDSYIYDRHSCPKAAIVVCSKGQKLISIKTGAQSSSQDLPGNSEVITCRRQYSYIKKTGFQLRRCITKLQRSDGSMARYAVISYQFSGWKNGNEVAITGPQLFQRPHGNLKKAKESYFRTKPSVLSKIREYGSYMRPKQVVSAIERDAGGLISISSPSDVPRNRMQVHNKVRDMANRPKARNTGKSKVPDYTKLVALSQTGDFIRDFSFHRNNKTKAAVPRVFASPETNLNWIKEFCRPSSKLAVPAGVDMTYKCGPFYVTTLTVEHPLFIYKDRPTHHPGILLAIMTSVTRDEGDYDYFATQLASSGVKTLVYGTDGEVAMERAFEKVFPITGPSSDLSIHLRCFSHLAEDMKRCLKGIGVDERSTREIIDSILGKEEGGVRTEGLVDAADEATFDALLSAKRAEWPDAFNQWLDTNKGRIRSVPEAIKKSMLKPVRIAANLGCPPSKYTNNTTESINLVIKEEQNHESRDLCSFLENIKEKVFDQQHNEMVKAVYKTGEFRLSDEVRHLSVDAGKWQDMNVDQRKALLKKIFSVEMKQVNRDNFASGRPLSVPFDHHSFDLGLPLSIAKQMWNRAEFIIASCSIAQLLNGNYCVTDYDRCETVTRNKDQLQCHCKMFSTTAGLCEHTMAVAEKNGQLMELLQRYCSKKNKIAKIIEANKPKRPGEKVHQRKKRKGRNNVSKQPIVCRIPLDKLAARSMQRDIDEEDIEKEKECDFSEYWHNDELFHIVHIKDERECKNAKSCVTCGKTFAKRNPVKPRGEIFISHKERYMRPVRDENGAFLRLTLTGANQLGRIFYCPSKSCVLKRHPYFWKGLLKVHESSLMYLAEEHYSFLLSELKYEKEY